MEHQNAPLMRKVFLALYFLFALLTLAGAIYVITARAAVGYVVAPALAAVLFSVLARLFRGGTGR